MRYELARQLKEAGFPQKKIKYNCQYCEDAFGEPEQPDVYFPTLSELIEACGKKFLWLKKDYETDEWYTEAYGLGIVNICKTPEEAVANLWLALNKQ